jgi:hypothetical protein
MIRRSGICVSGRGIAHLGALKASGQTHRSRFDREKVMIGSRSLTVLGSMILVAACHLAPGSARAQSATLTITGCASFTTSAGTSTTLVITCNQSPPPPTSGAPTCSSLQVSPAATTLTLIANCAPGANPITAYTFSGPGLAGTPQASNQLTISPIPASTTTYSVTATDGSQTSNSVQGTYSVGGGAPKDGSVDDSACTAQGFTAQVIDVQYPVSTNIRATSTTFGNSTALVFRFTTPSVAVGTPGISIVTGGYPLIDATHVVALSTQPCQFPSSSFPSGAILAAPLPTLSPNIGMSLAPVITPNPKPFGYVPPVQLYPNTTYFVTVVNRGGYVGTPVWTTQSCLGSTCNIYFNFHG